MTIEHKDCLGQTIHVGETVVICKNLWRGRDELKIAKVAKLTKARITFTNGSWSVPSKVMALVPDTYKLAIQKTAVEEAERLDAKGD
jgi:hypothetical protein